MTTSLTDMDLPAKVAVAMSGGVDSSAVAALLKEQGTEVVGLTLLLQQNDDAKDAKAVARQLGIEHHCLDLRDRFSKEVIGYFVNTYAEGQTPSPCVKCNRFIKFGALIDFAKEKGAQAFVTGHYARRVQGEKGGELHVAADPIKDQSYFLFALTQEQIDFSCFPLADLTKEQTRKIAATHDLTVAQKPDSQDICFVPDGDYIDVLKKYRPEVIKPGNIVDQEGNVLGHHKGIVYFTVGQRKGLNISDRKGDNNEPLFVLELDAERQRVIVGPRLALQKSQVFLDQMNWLYDPTPPEGLSVQVKLRSSMPPTDAVFFYDELLGTGRIDLKIPQFGVAKGQAGVVYHNGRVLGGGWIIGAQ